MRSGRTWRFDCSCIAILSKAYVVYTVVQYDPWFKFYFPLFQAHYHTIHHHNQEQRKIKFKPK